MPALRSLCRSRLPTPSRILASDNSLLGEFYLEIDPGTPESVSADGQWFLHGRSDDTIIRGGENIGPAEVEDALGGVQSVLVLGGAGFVWPFHYLLSLVGLSTPLTVIGVPLVLD